MANEVQELPEEMKMEIISHAPVVDLLRFKRVSRMWYSNINSRFFVKKHLQNMILQNRKYFYFERSMGSFNLAYEESPPGKPNKRIVYDGDRAEEFVATCNGLVCRCNQADVYVLYNPHTMKMIVVPSHKINFPPDATWSITFFGMGYHEGEDDYKLVRICLFSNHQLMTEVSVFSRNSHSWTDIGGFPYDYPIGEPGIFVNGKLHWQIARKGICALNINDWSYSRIELPVFNHVGFFGFTMVGLDNQTVALHSRLINPIENQDLWILKQSVNEGNTWTHFSMRVWNVIPNNRRFVDIQPLFLMKPHNVLVMCRIDPIGVFGLFDLRDETFALIEADRIEEGYCKVFGFVESLETPFPVRRI